MWGLLAVPPLGALSVLAIRRLYSHFAFGAGIVLLLFAVATVAITLPGADLGGLTLYPEDAVFGILAVTASLRLTLGGELRAQHFPWLLFAATSAASFAAGAGLYGVRPAGVEYRSFFYVIAACLYCGSFALRPASLKRFTVLWLWTAAALLAVACFRWSAEFLHLGLREQWAGVGGMNPMRVLNANQSLYLAQAFLVTVYVSRQSASRAMLAGYAAVLLVAVLLLQHRSVWVSLVSSLVVIAWRERAWRKFIAAGLVALVLAAPAYLLLSEHAATVSESLRESAEEPFDSSRSTIAWRTGLWQEYIFEFQTLSGAQSWLGTGFGNPAVYDVDGSGVSNAAHNYFVYTLNRAGILGLAAAVLCNTLLFLRLRGARGTWDYLGLFSAITAGQLVFYMAYGPSFEQGLLSGTVLGLSANSTEEA